MLEYAKTQLKHSQLLAEKSMEGSSIGAPLCSRNGKCKKVEREKGEQGKKGPT
jgi:hypothetical protein